MTNDAIEHPVPILEGDDLHKTYRMGRVEVPVLNGASISINDGEWAAWISKTLSVSVDSTIASRFTDMDFSPEVQQRMNKIANAMLAVNAGAARAATAPL